MSHLREITVFSIGDASQLKTWSNVPYFFTKSLEEKGFKINRVDIEESAFLNSIYKYTVFAALKLFYKNSDHTFFRSGFNNFLTGQKIKKEIKNRNSDAFIFLSYSFSSKKYSQKKVILFSDWGYLYFIDTFLKREALWFEKRALKREENNIESADAVISLFPKSYLFNLKHYKNKHQYYLGNVINSNYPLKKEELISSKLKSNKLLFIGNKKYFNGAISLINAFKEVNSEKYKGLELHIIGLTEGETGVNYPNVFYYGYLDKGIEKENELYYKLISEAKAIINTNTDWGAFSAMTEAMFFYTPVITSPYEEFVETYGSEINFGYYVNNNNAAELTTKIEALSNLTETSLVEIMNNAHEKVKDFTWSNYSEKVLELLSTK